jgi:hypothetical protein
VFGGSCEGADVGAGADCAGCFCPGECYLVMHERGGGRHILHSFMGGEFEVDCFKEVEAEIMEEDEAPGNEGNVSLSASSKLEVRRDEKFGCSKTSKKLKLPETERVSDFAKSTTTIFVKLHEAPFPYAAGLTRPCCMEDEG